jgi:hypothetical protein
MRSRTPFPPAEPGRPIAIAGQSHQGTTRESFSDRNIDAKASGSICRDVTGQMAFAVWRSDPTCGAGPRAKRLDGPPLRASLRGLRVPIADAVAEPKLGDPEGELVAAARAIKTSFGDGVSST